MTLAHQFERIIAGGAVTDRIDMGDRVAIACALGGPHAARCSCCQVPTPTPSAWSAPGRPGWTP